MLFCCADKYKVKDIQNKTTIVTIYSKTAYWYKCQWGARALSGGQRRYIGQMDDQPHCKRACIERRKQFYTTEPRAVFYNTDNKKCFCVFGTFTLKPANTKIRICRLDFREKLGKLKKKIVCPLLCKY